MKIYSNLFLVVLVGLVIGCATQNIEEPMTPAKIEKEIYDQAQERIKSGNYSMAIDYFKKAVENDEEEMDYKVNLAVSLYRMYKYDQALEYYEVVKKAKPELVSQLDFIETMGESTPKFDKFD